MRVLGCQVCRGLRVQAGLRCRVEGGLNLSGALGLNSVRALCTETGLRAKMSRLGPTLNPEP